MTNPITFESTTPRFGLPLLFTAQVQKEFYVNEAHAITDMLLHATVEGIAEVVPTANEGQCWIVGATAGEAFSGQADCLACYQNGQWIFAKPQPGMKVFDRSVSQYRFYNTGWSTATDIPIPQGGSVVDSEARAAIAGLAAALKVAGILSA